MSWFRRSQQENEFDRELQFHLEETAREYVTRGMSPQNARRQAILDLGGKEQTAQALRDLYALGFLERGKSNLKLAIRLIRRAPGFAAAVILTLALGIGANSAVFSAINAVLLRPLPFPHGDELMLLRQVNTRQKQPVSFVAPLRLEDWNRMNSTFQAITGYYVEDDSETSGALPEKVTRAFVAPRFLQVWGIAPRLGRDFTSDEQRFGGPQAVLISHSFWQRRFHGDPAAIGKTIRFGSQSQTIIGIMPASFRFPVRDTEIWTPVPFDSPYSQDRESTWYTVIGRLKPGVSLEQARADLATVQTQLGKQFPKPDASLTVDIVPLKQDTIGEVRRSLWVLFGSVTLLLLLACSNIAALLLVRTAEREHEIAVRFSLGASRGRVIGQLLTEVFVLAVAGATLGLGLAAAASRLFRVSAAALPRVDEISLDWRIVLYTLLTAIVVTLLCGVTPAVHATRALASSLAHGGRTQVATRSSMQWILVGVQVALAVTLLVGAGLLLRSFQELARVPAGFDPSRVLSLHISGSWGETADMKGLTQRIDRTLDRLRGVPGVEAAATSSSLPGVPNEYRSELALLEGPRDPNHKILADNRFVSDGYFSVMRIPVLAGEPCKRDISGAIVNRSFAERYLSQGTAIGHHLAFGQNSSFPLIAEIRGIAGDAREQGLNTDPMPTVYWCVSAPTPDPNYLVRTRNEPGAMADTLRQAIHGIEPTRSVFDLQPLPAHLSDAFAENRLRTVLLTLFALTAVSLACVGLYGTLSYFVTTRRREIGLRLALGAMRQNITWRYLLQGLRVSSIGCAAGLALAAASGRLLSGMLFGVSSLDGTTFLAVLLLVLAVAGFAAFVPALRASRTDPMSVLREE